MMKPDGEDMQEDSTRMEIPTRTSSATVKDGARQANVSVGTVPRVFNNYSNVSQEIRQRVLQAAEDIEYRRLVLHRSEIVQIELSDDILFPNLAMPLTIVFPK